MLIEQTAHKALPKAGHWQERLKTALAGCARDVAGAISPGVSESTLETTLIKNGNWALSLKAKVGDRIAFLKVFDDSDFAGQAYERERSVLQEMQKTRLVPQLMAFSDLRRFLLMRFERGLTATDPKSGLTSEDLAFRIGTWTAHFDSQAPSQPTSGNWYSYLIKFGDQLSIKRIKGARDVLSAIPLCGLVLARNDAALHNFMLRRHDGLVGCDFEQATLRPRGWDYMMTYQALLQRFPESSDATLAAFSDGFSRFHRGALIMDELNNVARILFCAQVIAGRQPDEEAMQWR